MRMSGISSTTNNNNPGVGGSSNHGNNMTNREDGFVEVWAHNLEDEFVKIRRIVQKYPYISMVGKHLFNEGHFLES